jgi:BCD family chlorophyll transporter-like MFS transporter
MTAILPWLRILRLGLIQASIGAIVVFATSTLNRVMVVELALPAIVPGTLVSLHYMTQILRPRFGHGSDRGGRQTPWIVGGMLLLAGASVVAALATALMKTEPTAGVVLALAAFIGIGIGVGASGTALLVLLAKQVEPSRRAAAASLVWMMMIAGFIVTAGVGGRMLDPFSIRHLVTASAAIAGTALLISLLAVFRIEGCGEGEGSKKGAEPGTEALHPAAIAGQTFLPALRAVWAEPDVRCFTLFVFLSMLAYSAQELILEPFAGSVFGLSPAESARLAGLQHSGLLCGMVLVAVFGSLVGGPRLSSMRLWTSLGCLASAIAILGLAAAGLAGSAVGLRCDVFGLGCANGAFSIAAIGAMMQLAGSGRAGREGTRMGLWGAAQALAFAAGGLVGTGASDLSRQFLGAPALAYSAVFVGQAILFCVSAHLATRAFPRPALPAAGRRKRPVADFTGRGPKEKRWAI